MMSKLLESIDCLKGITLNSQLVDLLSILDENISKEEQDKKIEEYINVLKNREESFKKEISKAGEPYKITDEMSEEEKDKIKNQKKNAQTRAKNKFVIDEVIDNSPVILKLKKSELKDYYFQRSLDLKICDREFMLQDLQRLGFDKKLSEVINNNVLSSMKSIDFTTKEGIVQLNPDDIRNLYSHMFENGNTYDRITFDNAGKYSLYVSVDGETYEPERLDKMVGFAEKHNMKSKINTFMMYCDFPKNLESSLDKKIENGEITESDKKAVLKKSLINYVQDISSKYGDRIDTVDIFNELIYDPKMKEDGFDEEATYHYRKEGWQKYLDIEDLCEMALVARKNMPNTKFTYNDMNWVDPEKRVEIIKIIKQIQEVEKRYIQEGKLKPNERLIDNIGLEAHLTTETSVEEIENTIKDLEENFDLPIEVTELDCARVGKNPLSKEEINKQNAIFRKFQELSKERRISALTIWSQSDRCSFMNNKCHRNVYASVLDDNFEEKDIENMKDINVLLQQKQNEYKIILSKINPEIIKKTLEYIRMQKQNVKKGKSNNKLVIDDDIKSVFEIMEQYQQEIKQLYMDSGETLTHITDVSPENMLGEKISKSHNRENHYNTERGNWVFASSEPVDGTNVYMARKSKDGLMIIAEDIYIYGGDNMKIEQDDQGKNHLMLKSPNYIYKINPKNFTPVVTLMESPEKNLILIFHKNGFLMMKWILTI